MKPQQALKEYFGYDTFRPLQEEIIQHVLTKKDALVLMPTGGGKSICFQIPAIVNPGITIVISPLIALMKDQVEALLANGVEAAYLNSTLSYEEQETIIRKANDGILKLLYIAPEKLFSIDSSTLLKGLNISLFAIDESHCISSWGHDFRPEYRKLDTLKIDFPEVPVLALTATADKVTRKDICKQLGIPIENEFISSFDRPNISLKVSPGRKKLKQIENFLLNSQNQSGIIYCLSRKGTETVAASLQKMGFKADFYHAGCSADLRSKRQEDFINDDLQIIVATVAFGMGIDKSNVRWVIHYNLPGNVESFYQEIGRGGRDGENAKSLLFYSYADIIQRKRMIDNSELPPEQKELMEAKLDRMRHYAEANICRRRILLSYFNEDLENDCGNCDVCKNPRKRFDGTVITQKALSGIARTGEKVGMGMLIDILRGSRNQNLMGLGYDKIPTFGVGTDLKWEVWADYLMQMLNSGAMEIAYDEGHTYKLSEVSWQILKGKRKVELSEFVSFEEKKAQQDAEVPSGNAKRDFIKNELFEKLRQLRKEIADKAGIPPYVVFHDSSLLEMATDKPIIESQMLAVGGVGQEKLKKYGKVFLKEIVNYVNANKVVIKGMTYTQTLQLFKEGNSLEEIAVMRKMSPGTIAGHLVKLKSEGEDIDLKKLIDTWSYDTIIKGAKELGMTPSHIIKPLFEHLGGDIGYDKIRLAMSIWEAE
ncbi:DNA helicase RecQ [uncultured Arcticibacterium sp.]|uniref:DNA helicase RecQ n=1 Tax=uncultured Arcticibacterium sp. TaxID=2173042 RepID=UPI0030F7173B